MPEEPWLTVVTVVRNDAAALTATLASVAAQRESGAEHLVVDGASTDGTTELAVDAAAGDPSIRVLSEPDDGIYDAMNKGWRAARGRAIHYLNAGDRYRTDDELHEVGAYLRHHDVGWLRTRVRFMDVAGHPTRPLASSRISPSRFWWGWQAVAHQGAFMTRPLIERLGGFDTRYRIVADYDLMRRALAAGVQPGVWDRVTVDVDAAGVSTQRFAQGYREMHHARSAGRPGPVRAASAVDAATHTTVVAARRNLRRAAERALGPDRVSRLRGGSG